MYMCTGYCKDSEETLQARMAALPSLEPKDVNRYPPGSTITTAVALRIDIHHVVGSQTICVVPYSVCDMHLRLSEVLFTHLDHMKISKSAQDGYALWYEGFVVESSATPSSIGLCPGMDVINCLEVREVTWKQYDLQLARMNHIGSVLNISRSGTACGLCPNTLTHVFTFLDITNLLSITLVSTYFHVTSQRYSLLMQLQFGSFSSLSPLHYPAWIKLLQEYSHCISDASFTERAKAEAQWQALQHSKESTRSRSFWSYGAYGPRHQFQKAAGCTRMRTVDIDCSERSVQQLAEGLATARTKFLTAGPLGAASSLSTVTEQKFKDDIREIEKSIRDNPNEGGYGNSTDFQFLLEVVNQTRDANGHAIEVYPPGVVSGGLTNGDNTSSAEAQRLPPDGHSGPFVAEAVSMELLSMSISIFRKKFSPDMHYIFPLIAYRQQLHGLDFRDCQTWIVFDGQQPAGAVAWRFRDPILYAGGQLEARGCLEVLFISVWEHFRNKELATELVAALEMAALKREGCEFMYVEIGHEQPLAKKFWAKNGFFLLNSTAQANVHLNQKLFFEHACLRFSDTVQFIKRV